MDSKSSSDEQPRFLSFVRCLAMLLTFITGFTGLVYEVAWHKYLSNLLGSQAKAAAIILAVFLGGLCVGYWLFGRLSRSRSQQYLVRLCGLVEIGIGLWVILFPRIYGLVWSAFGVLPAHAGIVSLLTDISVGVLLIAVPTVLMGGTLPLLTQGLSQNLREASPLHAKIYAANTFGAFAGCLSAGFLLLPRMSLADVLLSTAPLNIGAGLLFIVLALRLSRELPVEQSSAEGKELSQPRNVPLSYGQAAAVSLIAGFYAISLQIVFMRVVALSVGSSEYTFSMVVAAFILMLAVGAWRLAGRNSAPFPLWCNQLIVLCGAILVYLSVSNWPYWVHVLRTLFTAELASFFVYHAAVFFVLCLVLAIPVGAMGGTMPLVFRFAISRFDQVGTYVGRLYGWNTLGCVLGAVVGGYWLLYSLNLDDIYLLCLGLMLLTVLLSYSWKKPRGQAKSTTVLLGVLFAAVVLVLLVNLPSWKVKRLHSGLFRVTKARTYSFQGPERFFSQYQESTKVLFAEDGPNTSVAVVEIPAGPKSKRINNGASYVRSVKVNGKSDGMTSAGDMGTMRLSAHLPALLTPMLMEKVAVVGFGLGVTIGSVGLYPEVKNIHCIEISPVVRDVAAYFDFANHNVTGNSRVRWSLGDAYRVLGGSDERYSLIISEPSNPWVTGVERLYAREFFELTKSRLTPSGIYAQWFHTYSMSQNTLAMVMNTFRHSYPHVRIFHINTDLILLGSKSPIAGDSIEMLERRYQELPKVRESLEQIGIPNIESLLAAEVMLPIEVFEGAPIHSLEFPRLAFAAGIDFFRDAVVDIIASSENQYNRPWSRRAQARALIGAWVKQSDDQIQALKRFAKARCGKEEARLFSGWHDSQRVCRNALSALAIVGAISLRKNDPAFEESDRELLRPLVQEPGGAIDRELWFEIGRELNTKKVESLITLFKFHDSAFLPLSAEKLLLAAQNCMKNKDEKNLECRAELIKALAFSGYGRRALGILLEFGKQGGKELSSVDYNKLERIVAQAVEAERSVSLPSLEAD